MKVSIVGLGELGRAIAAAFIAKKIKVIGVDTSQEVIAEIESLSSRSPADEVEVLLKRGLEKGLLKVTTDYTDAILSSDITMVSVSAPFRSDGSVSTAYIEDAAKNIGLCLKQKDTYHLVVLKNLVPPGFTLGPFKELIETFSQKNIGTEIGLCYSPEIPLSCDLFEVVRNPALVIIGEYDKRAGNELVKLYRKVYGLNFRKTRLSVVNAEIYALLMSLYLYLKSLYISLSLYLSKLTPGSSPSRVLGEISKLDKVFKSSQLIKSSQRFEIPLRILDVISSYSTNIGLSPLAFKELKKYLKMEVCLLVDFIGRLLGGLDKKHVMVVGFPRHYLTAGYLGSTLIQELADEISKRGGYVLKIGADQFEDEKIKEKHKVSCILFVRVPRRSLKWDTLTKYYPNLKLVIDLTGRVKIKGKTNRGKIFFYNWLSHCL